MQWVIKTISLSSLLRCILDIDDYVGVPINKKTSYQKIQGEKREMSQCSQGSIVQTFLTKLFLLLLIWIVSLWHKAVWLGTEENIAFLLQKKCFVWFHGFIIHVVWNNSTDLDLKTKSCVKFSDIWNFRNPDFSGWDFAI